MTLNDIIDINLLDRFLTNLKNLFLNKDGTATRTAAIPFGKVDSTSTATAFTATVEGITELKNGTCVYLMNGVVTSAAASTTPKCFTLNINNLGAKPVYYTTAATSYATTQFGINYTMLFVYNTTRVSSGCWDIFYGYDSNTNTLGYQLRTNSSTLPAKFKTYRYRLLFTSPDGTHFVAANASTSTDADAAKTVTTEKIDPFGPIVYYGYTTAINANANFGATYLWTQYTLNIGYSFNRTGAAASLTFPAPIYVKAAPQSDGSAIIDADNPYVQTLPSTADGKIYIFLGLAYSATGVELRTEHPVYYYKDGCIRQWTNAAETDISGKANTADLADVAFSGSYNDLEGTPTIPMVPTNVSAFNNDAGYLTSYTESDPTVPSHVKGITTTDISNWNGKQAAIADLSDIRSGAALGATALQSYTETDPTVPAWAKAANKPSYTAAEVGALPDSTTIPSASTATPQMDGTGAAGSASTYAKGDHVHPTDTSREARVTTVSHGTNDTTFALTPNVLHTWGTINSLTLSLASGSSTYVDGYWFKFTAGSSFTSLALPTGVDWVTEPEIEAGKTYEVMIVDGLASYVTDGIGDTVKAKTRIVNHGTSDTTYQLAPNEFHIWGEVASLTLTLKDESTGFVDGYWFRFTCGSTPTVLTLPSSVEWYYEEAEFEANHTYEVTIVEDRACYTDYASTTQLATKNWVENYVDEHGGSGNVSSTTVTTIVSLTEAEYTALTTKDSSTLYIITSS